MMRTYGRITDPLTQAKSWVVVTTDAQGFDDLVWFVTLVQTVKLSRNESPFYANYGIPAQQSVLQQVPPDYYVALTQQQYSGYFAALTMSARGTDIPTYDINATFHSGATASSTVQIPQ